MSARPSSTTQAVVLEAFQDAMESAHGYRPQVFASGVLVNSRDADRFEGYQLALTAAQQTEAKCCMCGASVDTRENGTPGAQLTDGRWTCSDSCWERAAGDQTEARGVVDGWSDETIIAICKTAGVPWIEPETDENGNLDFPGAFDLIHMPEMRRLLAAAQQQGQGGGEVDDESADASVWTLIALMERVGGERDSGEEGSFITMTLDQVYALEALLTARGHDPGWVDTAPPSAPDYPITATCRVCDYDYRCVPVPAKCGTCGSDLPPSAPVGVEGGAWTDADMQKPWGAEAASLRHLADDPALNTDQAAMLRHCAKRIESTAGIQLRALADMLDPAKQAGVLRDAADALPEVAQQPAAPSAPVVDEAMTRRIMADFHANDPGDVWPPDEQGRLRRQALQDAINKHLAAAPALAQQPAAEFRNDGNSEADFIAHHADACTACGGSGHKADQQPAAVDEALSHADLCRLSRVFNAHNDLRVDQDRRINEWLGKRIAAALAAQHQEPTTPP